MLVLVIVLAVVVIALVAYLAVPGAGGGVRLGRASRSAAGRRPADGGRRRRSWPRRPATQRVLLAEGEEIQRRVEDRLTAQGVAPHRLAGPNPPLAADRPAPAIATNGIVGDRRQPPLDTVAPDGQAAASMPYRADPHGAPAAGLPDAAQADAYADPYAEPDPLVPADRGYGDGRPGGGWMGSRRRRGERPGERSARRFRD
jgi:hypothetical protein